MPGITKPLATQVPLGRIQLFFSCSRRLNTAQICLGGKTRLCVSSRILSGAWNLLLPERLQISVPNPTFYCIL